MSIKPILSVGIDVGTTSTHLTLSRLYLANVSRAAAPERIVIERREIVYQSPIQLTPLLLDGTIDAGQVVAFLQEQYQLAGITSDDIASGAVIVTGETALLRNAEVVTEKLSHLAGKFVVASAGPNLESILAGRGSGAAEYSKLHHKTICNIDIGGGTSNYAIFKDGQPQATAAISIGGRFLCLSDDLKITRLTQSGQTVGNLLQEKLAIGEQIDVLLAKRLSDYAAQSLVNMLIENRYSHPLLITEPLNCTATVDEYWFSGGVAEIMANISTRQFDTEYGDMGVFLARSLSKLLEEQAISFFVPPQPIRATVIGAGIYSLQLTGSTVAVSANILPLLNVPVIRPFEVQGAVDLDPMSIGLDPMTDGRHMLTGGLDPLTDSPQIDSGSSPAPMSEGATPLSGESIPAGPSGLTQLTEGRIALALGRHDLDWQTETVAIFLPILQRMGYVQLGLWAGALAHTYTVLRGQGPLVVICSHDVGAALGQLLRQALPGKCVICLDGIDDEMVGDYIDIGQPIASQQAIPVVIKDLVFGAQT